MIFAAGFGTRMGALTADRPKPLVEVAGRPLIDHALALGAGAGVGRVVVNLHYRGEMLAEHLAGRPGVALSWERARILDTGGGLVAARPLLGEGAVWTLNSDAVWTGSNPLAILGRDWDARHMGALLMLVAADAARGRGQGAPGDFALAPDGRLVRGGPFVYTGAQVIATGALDGFADPVFSLNRVWDRLIAEGRAYGVVHDGGWCDVGHPGGIAEAEAMIAGNLPGG
jgi:MurNAc alpha-1-phosphate uridylyltransferase